MDRSTEVPVGKVSVPEGIPAGGVYLKKGQKINLVSDSEQKLDIVKAGLSWDTGQKPIDLDVECFMLGQDGRVIGDQYFVFYDQAASPDGAVQHSGDVRDDAIPGDDETITIALSKLDQRVRKLVFIVTINEARERGLNFSQVRNAWIRIVDCVDGQDLCVFRLTDCYTNVISMNVGEIYNHNGQWKFNPVGEGLDADLHDLCRRYGVSVSG